MAQVNPNDIINLYQTYLHRTPSQDEIATMQGNPNGYDGVLQTILSSPEYAATGTASSKINIQNPTADPNKPFVQAGDTGGYLLGTGVTIGPGRSTTPEQAQALYQAGVAKYGQAAVDDFLARNPNDYTRIDSALAGDGGGGGNGGGSGSAYGPSGNQAIGSPYAIPARPDYLQGPYTPPTWTDTYTPPSLDDLTSSPGYLADEASIQRGLERSAAANGSILSGGFVGRALPRALADFTSTAYQNLNNNLFQQYQQRYGQFTDAASMAAQARALNEGAYQADVANSLNQYNTRYRAYQDAINNNLSYAQLGLNATTAGAPVV